MYGNVKTDSVTTSNHGYANLAGYYGAGYEKPNTMGTDFSTKTATYNYLYGTPTPGIIPILNIIKTGTFLGSITSLNSADLANEGLDFGHFSANDTYTFCFKFDRSLLPKGGFVSHVFEECGNDGIAVKDVPEPSAIAGIAAVGLIIVGAKMRRRQEAK
ncbi:MAG TPA: hypothetical protein DEG17_19955 [Cyanobacteria bacterium UBA11149]|nr:hypothetical protein [Cyanobacteria bacterium UBA11366]HBK62763.1 hypothetical protein [Cyanobacteria bacterium UBA11166]HBR76934.1 hypothetical protein [Cyanobacteria bacterium UBA11159]HBS68322.1 hypothetical protein [Cyanobacteria bacterium UBA11153]HBW91073.1 hypothetical protein [Cyanobacteria bacterium UBA11149]HCA94725.1 hypothetical protein [Cyanobacteria bacterium UBA9226]